MTQTRSTTLARRMYADAPGVLGAMQRWRPHICPFDRLVEAVPPGSKVFDIGCGGGLFLGLLGMSGRLASGIGVDSSERAIGVACDMAQRMSLAPVLRFEQLDVDAPWPDGQFDLVSMVDVVHHVPPPLQRGFIEQAASRVQPGGRLLYKDMAASPWWAVATNRLHDLLIAREWVHMVPVADVVAWLEAKHFRATDSFTVDTLWYRHEGVVFDHEG